MTENEVKAIVREIIMNYAENGEERYSTAYNRKNSKRVGRVL